MIGTDNQLLTEPVQTLPLAACVSLVRQDGSAAEFTLRLSTDLNMLSTNSVLRLGSRRAANAVGPDQPFVFGVT